MGALFRFLWFPAVPVAFVSGLLQLSDDVALSSTAGLWVFALSFAYVVLGLVLQLQRDPYSAYTRLVLLSLAPGFVGLFWLLSRPANPFSVGLLVTGVLVLVPSAVLLVRSQRADPTVPDLLAQQFGRKGMLECAGVQLVSRVVPVEEGGRHSAIELVLQNCWDAPRTFTLELEPPKGVYIAPTATATLAPLEVGVLTLPIARSRELKQRQITLVADPRVSGSGGKRVRAFRAQIVSGKVTVEKSLVAALLGFYWFGGGLRFRADTVSIAASADPARLPAVEWRRVWAPREGAPISAVGQVA